MAKRRNPDEPMSWPVAVRRSGLRGPRQAVLLALFTHIGWSSEDGECWPSVPTVALASGTCEQTARRALRALRRAGIIERVEPSGYKGRQSNTYWVSLSELRRRAKPDGDDDLPPVSATGGDNPDAPAPRRPPPLHAVDPPPLPGRGESSGKQTREPKPPLAPPEGGRKDMPRRLRRESHAARVARLSADEPLPPLDPGPRGDR